MEHLFAIKYAWLIPLLPLIGAAIAGLFGARLLKSRSHWPIWLGVGASAVLSIVMLSQMAQHTPDAAHDQVQVTEAGTSAGEPAGWKRFFSLSATRKLFTWIEAGNFRADAAFFLDPLTAVMLCVVTGIGFFITVFAAGYMKGEAGYFRFFAYLGLFVFMMTMLVMGDNFVMLYLGWEGVGLCSYLLIGYYYEKPAAREAAKKAFLVNRIGDFGFGLGIMLIYVTFGTVSYFGTPGQPGALIQAATIAQAGVSDPSSPIFWIPFLLMLGAFGKSAQFPLYVWLPDAMEGPTPVSALIHAATMVTAGVYMIVRCSAMFYGNAAAMATIAAIGAFTALFAATIALRQFDLKKVFAYSTISQLGFMFVAAAVLAPVAAIFHLVTHAFFKALLFLSSGVVMHAMAGELDMRKMSGLKRVLPWTRWLMLIGCLALAGVIPLSGFWSKDEILIASFINSDDNRWKLLLGLVMSFTALLTAYYTFRLYFRVFEGPQVIPAPPEEGHAHHAAHDVPQSGVDKHLSHPPQHGHAAHGHGDHHNHEPALMIFPLVILAIGALFAGLLAYHHVLADFLGNSPSFKIAFNIATNAYDHQYIEPAMFGSHRELSVKQDSHAPIMAASILIAGLGILLAGIFHWKDRPRGERLVARFPQLSRLLEAKYWVDEIYQAGIVEPLRMIGRAMWLMDDWIVDGVVKALGFAPQVLGFGLKLTVQRGSLQGYGLAMMAMIALIMLVWFAAL